jgi:GntR family transcriptional regulator, transcriptional repressor for pyruvate dehydrogenase complex
MAVATVPSRTDLAYRLLLELMSREGLGEGDRLPSEKALQMRLGLSRNSLREALARLRAEGRTVSRRGGGTYVVRRPPTELLRLSPIADRHDLLDWHEVRLALESEAVALAAERQDDDALAIMHQAQGALVARLAGGHHGEAEDAAFHLALAIGSRNEKLIGAVRALNEHIHHWIAAMRATVVLSPAERLEIIAAEHVRILDAVAARDIESARTALRQHLLNGRVRMLGSLGK